jgi:D-alanyl-D-alanine carboxypeptidase (penicillin-binding protein 5/6)
MHGEQQPVLMYEQGEALLDYGFSLPRDASVGQLTQPAPGTTLGSTAAAPSPAGAATPDDDAASPTTGTTNWETPVAIGAVVVLGLVVLGARLRRRRG